MAKVFDVIRDENEVPEFFTGEDKQLVITMDPDLDGTVPDVSGWELEWSLRRTQTSQGAAMLSKSTTLGGITVAGVHSPAPGTNAQKIFIDFVDTDTISIRGNVTYAHSLKRMDDGNETVLAYGDFYLGQVTER